MRRSGLSVAFASLALIVLGMSSTALALDKTSFDLAPKNAACLPNATGTVTVFHKEDVHGVDSLQLRASGLPPNTDFAVFLTEADAFATPPFGAVEYIGDFTTNAAGVGSLKVDAIIMEAFALSAARVRTNLDHLVFWFADPAQVPACFGNFTPGPFDGDGNSGPAAMSSQGATGLEDLP
jgi:hypothetical protein